jgi:hypothetical protein
MNNPDEKILQAQAAVAEAESSFGNQDVRVSYKLDALADLLKERGRLLEAANAAARARAIRTEGFSKESQEQAQRYGDVSDGTGQLSAVQWLRRLHRWALVASAVGFVIALLFPTRDPTANTVKGLVGTSLAAVFIQLLLFPLKSMPRMMKWTIVAIGSGVIGMILFR